MNYIRPRDEARLLSSEGEQAPFYWLANLLAFLSRRWPTIAVCAAAAVALGLVLALTTPPRYTAQAALLFDVQRVDLLRQQLGPQDALTLNSVLESQVELLHSAGLARKTVERLGLTSDRTFVQSAPSLLDHIKGFLTRLRASGRTGPAGPETKLDLAAQQLQGMLKVWRVGQTYVLAVSVTSPSREEAAWLANGVTDSYLADELQAKEAGIQQASGWLQVRLRELHDQAVTADRAVQDFKAAHHIIDTERGLMGNQQLTELTSQLVSAKAQTAAMQARLQRIQSVVAGGVDGGAVTDGLDNKVIVTLRQQYVDDDKRLADLTPRFGPDHTVVRALRSEMAEIKKAILGELSRIADTYRSDYDVAAAAEASVQRRLDQSVAAAARTNNDLVELRSLQSSADTYRSLYQNFLQRYTQAVQDESFPVSEARVITTALPPLRKSEPKTTIIVFLFAVVGSIGGLALAFGQEVLDRGFRSAVEVRERTGLNCLAVVPKLRGRRLRRIPLPWGRRAASSNPPAVQTVPSGTHHQLMKPCAADFADAIRTLRLQIMGRRIRSGETKLIGCVSSVDGAGASVIASSLAQVLSQAGTQTLLIDWDFGRASVTDMFGLNHALGCSDVLAGGVGIESAVHQDSATGIWVMPVGTNQRASTSLMMRHLGETRAMLGELRKRYNVVIVDIPSLSTVADSHIAADMLDAVCVVMEWGRGERESLTEKLSRIGLDETNVLGIVLNKAESGRRREPLTTRRHDGPIVLGV
jgi:succinoglycan biosynthesis transport protein ExoP